MYLFLLECIISEARDFDESDDKNNILIKVQTDKKRARKEYTVNKVCFQIICFLGLTPKVK